jgi:AMP-binding enzyme
MIKFTVRPDLVIRYNRHDYSYDELSQAVSYWLNIINTQPPGPIGLAYSGLSFSTIALLLALYKSGRDYKHMGVYSRQLSTLDNLHRTLDIDAIFVAGDTNDDVDFHKISTTYIRTDCWHSAWECARWEGREDLSSIPFTHKQKISAYTSGTTGEPTQNSMSAYVEATSIETAQRLLFSPDDYCLFMHGMSHQGVHTSAILPAIFTAKTVSLANRTTWHEELDKATHIQYFYTMQGTFDLPKKVRVITTGGDKLKTPMLDKIKNECQYEHLYDIYGLTECLPPLAIRDVHEQKDLDSPFLWVNEQYSFDIAQDNSICITRPDNITLKTSDLGSREQDHLYYIGRQSSRIRVRGLLVTVAEFKQEFEQMTNIVSYAIEPRDNAYLLHIFNKDSTIVNQYVQDNDVMITVVSNEDLNTNGGIKNIT